MERGDDLDNLSDYAAFRADEWLETWAQNAFEGILDNGHLQTLPLDVESRRIPPQGTDPFHPQEPADDSDLPVIQQNNGMAIAKDSTFSNEPWNEGLSDFHYGGFARATPTPATLDGHATTYDRFLRPSPATWAFAQEEDGEKRKTTYSQQQRLLNSADSIESQPDWSSKQHNMRNISKAPISNLRSSFRSPSSSLVGPIMPSASEREFSCHICFIFFYTHVQLKRHLRSHIPEAKRAHACPECGERFSFLKDLERHRYAHGPNTFSCPVILCGRSTKGFSKQEHLDRHIRGHHPGLFLPDHAWKQRPNNDLPHDSVSATAASNKQREAACSTTMEIDNATPRGGRSPLPGVDHGFFRHSKQPASPPFHSSRRDKERTSTNVATHDEDAQSTPAGGRDSGMTSAEKSHFSRVFANELLASAKLGHEESRAMISISRSLPDLLRIFARALVDSAHPGVYHRAVSLLEQCISEISDYLMEVARRPRKNESEETVASADGQTHDPDYIDRMHALWPERGQDNDTQATLTKDQSYAHTQIASTTDEQGTPRMSARQTPNLDASSTLSGARPSSAMSSPTGGLSPSFSRNTPAGILKNKEEDSGGKGSRKRGSSISPSIRPLPQDSSPLHCLAQALLLASKSDYQDLLEGNHLYGGNYLDAVSTGLTSSRLNPAVEDDTRSEIQAGIQLLAKCSEYQWLVSQVRVAAYTTLGSHHLATRTALWRNISGSGLRTISGRRQIDLSLDWQPVDFLDQQYGLGNNVSLGSVICLNGTARCAQASTISEYVAMVWPRLGPSILESLDVRCRPPWSDCTVVDLDYYRSYTPFDASRVVQIVASGRPLDVLEFAEVLTWLSAACRTTATTERIDHCSSEINDYYTNVIINHKHQKTYQHLSAEEGLCWVNIFNNPVIVLGYPIRRRTSDLYLGLEMPLDMAVVLSSACFPTAFEGRFLFKGPCSALVPIKRDEEATIWHFISKPDLSPLTYDEALSVCADGLEMDYSSCMQAKRHYFGWTPKYKSFAGTKSYDYDGIRYGAKPIEGKGFALSQVNVSGSYRAFTAQTMFVPGLKDQRVYLRTSGSYDFRVKCFSGKKVVLFDTEARRGWLLDGITFLLHLSLAALSHPMSVFATEPGLNATVEQFMHFNADDSNTARATAEEILRSRHNQAIPLLTGSHQSNSGSPAGQTTASRDTEAMTFKDLVLHFLNVLEQLADHHVKLKNAPQWRVQNPFSSRKDLEGFDFLDILQATPDLRPRAAKLDSSASRWLKVANDAGTINVLGSGFGDIFESSADGCAAGKLVPCGSDVLAAPITILHRIATERCSITASGLELAHQVYWNEPLRAFGHALCRCNLTARQKPCTPTTVELEDHQRTRTKRKGSDGLPLPQEYLEGAVILGRLRARPENRSELSVLPSQSSPSVEDSGIEMLSVSGSGSNASS